MSMKNAFLLLFVLFFIKDVHHEETEEHKTVEVMEGENVTLLSGITKIDNNVRIVWIYGDTRLALMNREPGMVSVYDTGVFQNKLHLNRETGDITITHITTEHAGIYQLHNLSSEKSMRFMVNVTRLPIPVIIRDSSSSSDTCVVLCSVCNVSDVSLSWYKGMSLLSSISVSDLNIRLSLPLEVEYQDTDTYTCVVSNPVSNQTQQLNITHVCGLIPAHGVHAVYIALICIGLPVILGLAVVVGSCYKKRSDPRDRTTGEELKPLKNGPNSGPDQPNDARVQASDRETESHICLNGGNELNHANDETVERSDPETNSNSCLEDEDQVDHQTDGLDTQEIDDEITEEFKTVEAKEGESVTLEVPLVIEKDDVIKWKFAESKVNTVKIKVIAEWTNANRGEILCSKKLHEDRLHIDDQTGSLTISNITTKDTGHYILWIPGRKISKTFHVIVKTGS